MPGISDHDAITVTVNQNARVNRKPPRKVYQFKKVRDKCKQFCEYYTSQAQSHSASENWNTFKNGLNQVIEENIPTKTIKEKHNLPWITQSIKRIVRRRKRARCKARRTRSIPDWERYKELTKSMKREQKHTRITSATYLSQTLLSRLTREQLDILER